MNSILRSFPHRACRTILILLFAILLALTGCSAKNGTDSMSAERVFDYVMETGIYTELDYIFAEKYFSSQSNSTAGMCSAIATIAGDGDMIVGRNMDLTVSNKPAYIVRTKVKDSYETIGLTYYAGFGPDYQDALENGISADDYRLLPFFSTDVLNSEGLYIETNMRYGEYDTEGNSKFVCTGTNPDSDTHVYALSLCRYIAEHCATVDEALEYVKTLDINTTGLSEVDWPLCYLMADASGHYGVLEMAYNKLSWLDGQQAQTNFYLTDEFAENQLMKCGTGRYDMLMKGIGKVQDEEDMFHLIDSVSYGKVYLADDCPFDPRSEYVDTYEGWTYDYVMSEENQEEVMGLIREDGAEFYSMTPQEQRDDGNIWISVFSNIVNCNEKTLQVRFFENDEMNMTFSFTD